MRQLHLLYILIATSPFLLGYRLFFQQHAPPPPPPNRVYILMYTHLAQRYGQCGSQVQAMMDILAAVKGGSRVLVEPVFIIQPRNNTAYELNVGSKAHYLLGTAAVRWSQWLSLERLQQFMGATIAPWQHDDDDDKPTHIDLLLTTGGNCVAGPANFQMRPFIVGACQRVPVGKGLARWRRILEAAPQPVIGIELVTGEMFPEGIRWRDRNPTLWFNTLSAFEHSDEIKQMAVRQRPHPSPYACLHWRRGDRAHAEMSDYGRHYWQRSHPRRIQELVRRQVGRTLFIMTNSGNQAERNSLKPAAFLAPSVYPHWEDELKRLGVEMEICIRADAFIAIGADYWQSSTPSRLIIDWRRGVNVSFLS
jgi:hypothetical protein